MIPQPTAEEIRQHEPIWSHGWTAGFKSGRERVMRLLRIRERELLDLKGPCSNQRRGCQLHYAHSGPCDIRPLDATD